MVFSAADGRRSQGQRRSFADEPLARAAGTCPTAINITHQIGREIAEFVANEREKLQRSWLELPEGTRREAAFQAHQKTQNETGIGRTNRPVTGDIGRQLLAPRQCQLPDQMA